MNTKTIETKGINASKEYQATLNLLQEYQKSASEVAEALQEFSSVFIWVDELAFNFDNINIENELTPLDKKRLKHEQYNKYIANNNKRGKHENY